MAQFLYLHDFLILEKNFDVKKNKKPKIQISILKQINNIYLFFGETMHEEINSVNLIDNELE